MTRVGKLETASGYVMPFVDASILHIQFSDVSRLEEVYQRDLTEDFTPNCPLIARYPEGFFLWLHGDDQEDLFREIRQMRSFSREFRNLFRHFAALVGRKAEMHSVYIRLDRDGQIIPELKVCRWPAFVKRSDHAR